jgi:RNA polymerase sigma-70 factor (ECF subfamily)
MSETLPKSYPGASEIEVVSALARKHHPALLRYFRRHGFVAPENEDAAQEVFVRLTSHISHHEDALAAIERLDRYLFATAASVVTDLRRKSAVRASHRHESYDESLHAQEDVDPETALADRQSLEALVEALNELPERTRTIFALSRFEGAKQAAIAQQLGVTLRCVEKHLHKALAHLGQRVGRLR